MLWQRLDLRERARFLRHLQPFWDAARHRCAPRAHENLLRWMRAGTVRRIAGRITGWRQSADGGIEVTVASRGGGVPLALKVAAVINCTGPEADLARVDDPLVRHLLERGMARPDRLHLGIDVDPHGALLDASGRAGGRRFYVGPLLRGRDWEATAVPELRRHAHQLARHLLDRPGFSPAGHLEPTLGQAPSPLERWPSPDRVM